MNYEEELKEQYIKMQFPNTFEEFIESYSFVDDKEIYTNGSELIPTFRLKQWKEHKRDEKQQLISWLEDKIRGNERVREMSINSLNGKYADKKSENKINKILENGIKECDSEIKAFQEVLDFVNKGGKDD